VNIELIESIIFRIILNSPKAIKTITNEKELIKGIKNDIQLLEAKLNIEKEQLEKTLKRKKKLLYLLLDELDQDLLIIKDEIENQIIDHNSKIIVFEQKLIEKNQTLLELKSKDNSKTEFLKKSTDRVKLHSVFKQLISHSIINFLNKDLILVTTYFKIGNEVLTIPLKILIDLTEFRKKVKSIKYKSLFKMEFEPFYREGILESNSNEIIDEFQSAILDDWEIIPMNQFLKMKLPDSL
jgi:hypothetical protein